MVAAAILAGWGIGFGLPFLFRPDEEVVVGRAVRMAVEGSLDPLFSNWPPLVFDMVALALKLTGNVTAATGGDPSGAYLTGRVISAAAFVATVGLVFLAARRAYGDAAAILAAFITGLSPLAVRQAHMATIDTFETMLVASALLTGLVVRRPRGFALAGGLCGLAAAAKFTGGLSLVFVLVMAFQMQPRLRLCAAAAGGAAVAFLLGGWVMFLHPVAYADGLIFLGRRGFASDYGTSLGWFYHPVVTLPFGLGLGAYALALGGVAAALRRRKPVDLGLAAFVLAYLLLLGASSEVFWRYLLPLVPPLAVLGGGLLQAIPRRLAGPALGIGLLLLLPSLWASASGDRLLAATDTRRLAANWLEQNAPAGASIQASYYVSPFYDQAMVDHNRRWVDDPLAAGFMQGRYTKRYRMVDGDADYLIVGSKVPGQEPPGPVAGRPRLATFSPGRAEGGVYDPIDSFYVPIWGFGELERAGPTIAIYGR
jgi:4-amino-4-deoxy-L-arabinose transferase-like glycosyltransferase